MYKSARGPVSCVDRFSSRLLLRGTTCLVSGVLPHYPEVCQDTLVDVQEVVLVVPGLGRIQQDGVKPVRVRKTHHEHQPCFFERLARWYSAPARMSVHQNGGHVVIKSDIPLVYALAVLLESAQVQGVPL